MRRSKQNAIKIARAGIFALTFILAFAIVIAAPIESSTDVAFADVKNVYGGKDTIQSNKGDLNADNTGFNGSTLTITEEFSSANFTSSNVSYAVVNNGTSGTFTKGTGSFTVGLSGAAGFLQGYQVYAVLNYKIGSWLSRYMDGSASTYHTNATLEIIDFRADYSVTEGDQIGLKIFTTASPFAVVKDDNNASANTLGIADTPSTFAYVNPKDKGTYNSTTKKYSGHLSFSTKASSDNPIKISSGNTNIVMAFMNGGGNGATPQMTISNISFKIRIKIEQYDGSKTIINDGEAPILKSVDSMSPNRANNSSNWNYNPSKDITTSITDEIKSLYNQNLDRVDANNNVYLHSYVNPQADGQTTSGKTYYKSVTETFVDQYSYGSSTVKVADDSSKKWNASGIKYVKVGDTYLGYGSDEGLWAFDKEGQSTELKEIKVEGKGVGWGRVYVYHRSKVQVQLYFYDNADVTITVSDYGDKQVAKTVSVKGIDSQTNTEMESILKEYESYFMESNDFVDSGSWADLKWFYSSEVAFEFDSVKDANGNEIERDVNNSPYMWFYSVVKAGSIGSTLTSANWQVDDMMANKVPFAVDSLTFKYDFKTGLANGETPNQNGGNTATGSGYYLFTFYKVALSG
ncbi:MAG: hypothetical protein J6R34_01485, partial [Clostridia bacterium]|nr:hypothetical protein [Clostridia bacterium]